MTIAEYKATMYLVEVTNNMQDDYTTTKIGAFATPKSALKAVIKNMAWCKGSVYKNYLEWTITRFTIDGNKPIKVAQAIYFYTTADIGIAKDSFQPVELNVV